MKFTTELYPANFQSKKKDLIIFTLLYLARQGKWPIYVCWKESEQQCKRKVLYKT